MLVLSRKPGEKLNIGSDIVITIIRTKNNQVRIGIEAPDDVRVLRSELEAEPVFDGPADTEFEQLI